MNKDINVMKTSVFGGFKKSDVLAYIEKLQTETADVREQLDAKRTESIELKRKIEELEVRLDNLSEVTEKLNKKENEVAELSEKLNDALSENKQYLEKITEFQEKSDKLKRAEKQIGAAYIDARRYSDEIVDNAKLKAKDIGALASQDVKREANEIEQLLKDVDAISKKFNSSLEQLHKDVYALGTKLNTSASTLLNLHTDLTGIDSHSVEFEIDTDIPEDAIRVERADDDSGLTFITYAPNTEFNEDLNIQPDAVNDWEEGGI